MVKGAVEISPEPAVIHRIVDLVWGPTGYERNADDEERLDDVLTRRMSDVM